MGKGGYKRGGGACEVLPIQKGGEVEKVLAILKGAQQVLGSFNMGHSSLNHTGRGGTKGFCSLNGGGGCKKFTLS